MKLIEKLKRVSPTLIVIVAISFAGIAFVYLELYLEGRASLSKVEETLGITLPEEANVVTYSYSSWLDISASIRFELDEHSYSRFISQLESLCLDDGFDPIRDYNQFGTNERWETETLEDIMGQQCNTVNILVGRSKNNENIHVIFLNGHR